MSGTSLDGIDVAIVDIDRSHIETIAFRTTPYPRQIQDAILALCDSNTTAEAISRLDFLLGEMYAEAVIQTCRAARVKLQSIELIGSHGQTIYHESERKPGHTLQIGEAAVIAERTGIPVVSDFRPSDIAAGGKGAPLVPYVDYLLFRDARRGRVALNIGGIANVTAIPPAAKPQDVVAFDTGPGNMVIDALTVEYSRGKRRFDHNGRIAAKGAVNRILLEALTAAPYYSRKPPKTCGREQYGAQFVQQLRSSGLPLRDLIATATVLTAVTVAIGIKKFIAPQMRVDELIVSGGGAHNPQILGHLTALLPGIAIATSADYGIDIDAKEAIAFAVLAHQTWKRRPSNLPSATGARRPVILGKVSFAEVERVSSRSADGSYP